MLTLSPAIISYLTSLTSRLELSRKTDVPELDLKHRNAVQNMRSKLTALLNNEVSLASACPITAALMEVWVERQKSITENVCPPCNALETKAVADDKAANHDADPERQLASAEERAIYRILNDKTTTTKLKDVKELFTLVNEICETLKNHQSEVRKLKASGVCPGNDHNLIANLRLGTTEELAASTISGRVWVDCVIDQVNQQSQEYPVSPLFNAKQPEQPPASLPTQTEVDRSKTVDATQVESPSTQQKRQEVRPTIYENIVSFETQQVEAPGAVNGAETLGSDLMAPFLDSDLFANPSVLRPAGRRARVKFNTQRELQETALLGLDVANQLPRMVNGRSDSHQPVKAELSSDLAKSENLQTNPLIEKTNPLARQAPKRRASINTHFLASMDQLADELNGLSKW